MQFAQSLAINDWREAAGFCSFQIFLRVFHSFVFRLGSAEINEIPQ